jgi:hypothetical protein
VRHRTIAVLVVALAVAVPLSAVTLAQAGSPVARTMTGTGNVTSISCPTATLCWAAGWTTQPNTEGFIAKIVNGIPSGATVIDGAVELDALSCPTTTFCLAVADQESGDNDVSGVMAIRNGNAGKLLQIAGDPSVFDVSCSSAKSCEAVGDGTKTDPFHDRALVTSVSNGKPGHAHAVKGSTALGSQLDAVSCPTSASCVAVGGGVFGKKQVYKSYAVRITKGKATPPEFGHPLTMTSISCYSAAECYAAGYDSQQGPSIGYVESISNGSLGAVQDVHGSSQLLGISCRDAGLCQASGNLQPNPANPNQTVGVVDRVIGGRVSPATTVTGTANLQGDSCPTYGLCASSGDTSNDVDQVGTVVATAVHPKKSTLTVTASPAHGLTKNATLSVTAKIARDSGRPRPTGIVTFTSGKKTLCNALPTRASGSNAQATCKAKGSALGGTGKHTVKATYIGDTNYLGATKAVHETVVKGK